MPTGSTNWITIEQAAAFLSVPPVMSRRGQLGRARPSGESYDVIDPFADLQRHRELREALDAERAADEAFRAAQQSAGLDMNTPQGRAAIARHRGQDPVAFEREFQRGARWAERHFRRQLARFRPRPATIPRRRPHGSGAAGRRRDTRRTTRLVASSASGSGDVPPPPRAQAEAPSAAVHAALASMRGRT
jgi:hypothetical protein